MRTLILRILAYPRTCLVLLLALLALSGLALTQLRFDNTPDSFFMRDDPALIKYTQYKADFGSDEYSFLVLDAPAQWTPAFIASVRDLGARIEAMDNVNKVTTIASVRHIASVGDGGLDVGPFLGEALDASALAAKRSEALAHPYYRNLLISGDGRHLGILAETGVRPGEIVYKIELAKKIRALAQAPEFKHLDLRVVGAPIIDADVFTIINRESAIFGTLSFILVSVGFWLIFRSWAVALLPLVVASLSIVVAMAVSALIGAPIGMLTAIIPSFLISVGVGSSIFLLAEVYRQYAARGDLRTAIVEGFSHSAGASALSVLTTAGALLSFSWSEIRPVQGIGISMAAGLVASLLIGWLLIPLALSRFRLLPDAQRAARLLDGRVRGMHWLAGFVTRRWRMLLLVLAGLIAIAGFGVARVTTDYYYVGLFKPHTDIYRSYTYVDQTLRGAASMELIVDSAGVGGESIKDPAVLKRMRELQDRLEARYGALGLKTYSIADVVMEISQALHEGDKAAYRIPDSRAEVAESLILFESSGTDELTRLVTGDYAKARINLRMKYRPDSQYQPLFRDIQAEAERILRETPQIRSIETTGVVPLWSRLTNYLASNEIRSIGLSFFVVLTVMVLVFRSATLGLTMALCNLVPVGIALAVMGFGGVFLDPFTLLVSAIAIGILDDDTLHFVKTVVDHYRRKHDMAAALRDTFASTGLAMLLLSSVLVLGFVIYMLSEVQSLAKFGGVTALAIGAGALCEFLFTPAVLMGLERVGLLRHLLPRESDSASSTHTIQETP
ncbi:efflux RND transporter permease subunit [Lysobacter antibioticus]|uniref:Sterol-sensing domain of SREBP cleavage-activation family protein n=1 Tax=Lysobacter antibioticus TaxID=84531 RepID=A0A0S2F5E8_LYSAN|nr:MMPL family transporter [Lysobacter antibioticus]ALN78763.1 sterol-sensing domain of SREBP cleavage-activation family protein [Lysobacter antibioticus]